MACHLIPVPNTDLVNKLYDVKYKSENNSEEISESKIRSDRIRLIRPTIVQESTGLGMWQTISIRIVNEEEEHKKQQEREVEEEKEKERLKKVFYCFIL